VFKASLGKKLTRLHLNNNKKLSMVAGTCHPSCMGNTSRKIGVQPGSKVQDAVPKNN
jgi:hypothetical protein